MPASSDSPRGTLKVYLGYAAGVEKLSRCLRTATLPRNAESMWYWRTFEPHARPDTIAQAQTRLEAVPHRKIEYREKIFAEMDTEAVLGRKPRIALVDELAHTNIPGSDRTKRWEDVQLLLDAGIEVWTTMNVQHIESLNDQIWQITGIQVRETVPDGIVRQAAEIVAVDVTPDALLNRLKRGAIYKPEMVEKALSGFFKGSNLGALRELALRQVAREVDLRQSAYDETRGFQVPRISEARPGGVVDNQAKTDLHPHPRLILGSPCLLIRRGRRVADYLHADCTALFVHQTPDLSQLPTEERQAVEKHLRFARSLQIETRILGGAEIAQTVVDFARDNHVTQIFVAHSQVGFLERLRGKNSTEAIVRSAQDLQVTVVADRTRGQAF